MFKALEVLIKREQMSSIDKSWSIKHEGHLNKNNIIFKDKKYKELYLDLKKVNDRLKEKKYGSHDI